MPSKKDSECVYVWHYLATLSGTYFILKSQIGVVCPDLQVLNVSESIEVTSYGIKKLVVVGGCGLLSVDFTGTLIDLEALVRILQCCHTLHCLNVDQALWSELVESGQLSR